MRAGSLLVFTRDARRASHRRTTWLVRVGLSSVLLGLVVLMVARAGRAVELWELAEWGRSMFVAWLLAATLLAVFAAPLVVAGGLDEEREEGTLELLVLSRMRPLGVLAGQVVARLLGLLTLMLAGVPALALVVTLGGVGPWEAVNGLVQVLGMAVLLGMAGGATALVIRGLAWPYVVSATWSLVGFVLIPVIAQEHPSPWRYSLGSFDAEEWLSPLIVSMEAHTPLQAALPLSIHGVILASLVLGAVLCFRVRGGGAPRRWMRWAWWAWVGHALLAAAALPGVALLFFSADLMFLPSLWLEVAILGFHSYTLYGLAVAGLAVLALVQHRSGSQRSHGPLRRWVWANPVLWRELTAPSPGRAVARATLVIWFLCTLLATGLTEGSSVQIGRVGSLLGLFALMATTAMLSTSSITEERGRTAQLLATTTVHPLRVIWGKLVPVAVRTWPFGLIVLGLAWLGWSRSLERMLALGAWAILLWTAWAAGLMLLALRLPRRAVWPTNLVLTGLVFFGAVLAVDVYKDMRDFALWAPVSRTADATVVLLSVQLQAGLATLLLILLAWRWRPWSARYG